MTASCIQCRLFIPDSIGTGQGIGRCRVYEFHKKKGFIGGVNKTSLLRRLGNKDYEGDLFWGGELQNRTCFKFEQK